MSRQRLQHSLILRIVVPMMAAALLAGCGEEAKHYPSPNYAVDIGPLLDAHCATCHHDGGPAPFRLDTYANVKMNTGAILPSITSRAMPPWGVDNSGACNTFQHARWLSDEQIKLVSDWADKGAPEGDPDKRKPFKPVSDSLASPSVTVTLPKYTASVKESADDYRCFVLKPGADFNGFMTAYEVTPGSKRTVHHVIVYAAGSAVAAAQAEKKDAAEAGPGYTCFGGPGVAPFNVLAGWAPGTPTTRFPEGVGLAVSGGSTLIVQVHYNLASGPEEDETKIAFQIENSVTDVAIARILADTDMRLAAGQKDAQTFMDIGGAEFGLGDLTIHGVLPHMHKRGTKIRVEVVDGDGKEACVANTPKWDFDWQQFFFFNTPVHVPANSVLRVSCHFDTSGDKDTLSFGDNTSDEMCVLGVIASIGKTAKAKALALKAGDDADVPTTRGKAPTADFKWTGGGAKYERPRDITLAKGGGVYLAGRFNSPTVTVGDTTFKLAGDHDGLVTALDADGKPRWSWHLAGPKFDMPRSALETSDGRVVVVSQAGGAITLSNGATWTSTGQGDILVAELDAKTGKLLKHWSFGGTKNEQVYFAQLDSKDELWVGGAFNGTVDFGDGKPITVTKRSQYLAKYTKSGVLRFVYHGKGHPHDYFWEADVGADDKLTMLADLVGEQEFGTTKLNFTAGDADHALIQFDANGAVVFSVGWGSKGDDWSGGVQTLDDGGVIATFASAGPADLLGNALPFLGARDAGVARFDPKGKLLWVKTFGVRGFQNIHPPVQLASGGIGIAAYVQGECDLGGGPLKASPRGDLVIAELTSKGEHVWSRRIGTLEDEERGFLRVDAKGRLWLYGGAGPAESGLKSGGGIDWILRRYPLAQ
ncbi:MAG: hypothetical protein KC502_15735 [Myxococcales bacterium]|nr:hypothetical protein [Myxococcales bacterium]